MMSLLGAGCEIAMRKYVDDDCYYGVLWMIKERKNAAKVQ